MYNLTPNVHHQKRVGFSQLRRLVFLITIALFIMSSALLFVTPDQLPTMLTQLQVTILTPEPTSTPDCRDEIKEYKRGTLAPILEEWIDAYDLASSTPRISLAPPVARLQDITRRLREIDPPPCAEGYHFFFIKAAESAIDGFLAFMANRPDSEVEAHFALAASFLRTLQLEATPVSTPTSSEP